MVDFEFIRQECPSIPFFFAGSGVFLEYSVGRRPQVGLFVSRFTIFKPVLLTLYHLIRQSLIKYYLEMTTIEYRDNDFRSSELETRLSSNAKSMGKEADIVVSKQPPSSSSTPLHALFQVLFFKKKTFEGL